MFVGVYHEIVVHSTQNLKVCKLKQLSFAENNYSIWSLAKSKDSFNLILFYNAILNMLTYYLDYDSNREMKLVIIISRHN